MPHEDLACSELNIPWRTLLIYMTNPKLSVHKFVQDGEFVTEWKHENTGYGGSLLPIQICIDFVKRIYVLDQRNSSIPEFSRKNTFIRPRLATEAHSHGRISALDFKLVLPFIVVILVSLYVQIMHSFTIGNVDAICSGCQS